MTIWRCLALLLALGLARPAWADLISNDNGTVTDSATHLVWDKCFYGISVANCEAGVIKGRVFSGTWAQALQLPLAANAARYKGFSDWRLPSKDEIEALIKTYYNDTFSGDDPFPLAQTVPFEVWTSTAYALDPCCAWSINFWRTYALPAYKTAKQMVTLVRGGQSLSSVARLAQTIRFTNPGAQTVGATPTLTATASSGLAHTFSSSTTGVCTTTAGGALSVVAVGTCTITASQAGNGSYHAAAPVRQSFSVVSAASPTIPPLPVDIPGMTAQAAIVNMAAGEGPAYMADLVAMLSSALGQPLRLIGQDAHGTVTLSGYHGGKLAFIPIDYQGGDPRADGIYHLGDGRYQVVRNGPSGGQSLVIAPALVSLDQLLALLPGVSVRQADNGVLMATLNGVTHVVQPGVAVQTSNATGSARLSMGSDGFWHFIDAQGNNQVLYPAFADLVALRNALQALDAGAISVIQLDATASVLFKGQRYMLVPDSTLSGVPTEWLGQSVWQEGAGPDGAARYRVVNNQPLGTAQGLTVRP